MLKGVFTGNPCQRERRQGIPDLCFLPMEVLNYSTFWGLNFTVSHTGAFDCKRIPVNLKQVLQDFTSITWLGVDCFQAVPILDGCI